MIPHGAHLPGGNVAKPIDPVAWAKAQRRNVGGRKCSTCADAKVSEVLEKWSAGWKDGSITISVRQARDFLAQHFDYQYTTGALKHCLAEHHGCVPHG